MTRGDQVEGNGSEGERQLARFGRGQSLGRNTWLSQRSHSPWEGVDRLATPTGDQAIAASCSRTLTSRRRRALAPLAILISSRLSHPLDRTETARFTSSGSRQTVQESRPERWASGGEGEGSGGVRKGRGRPLRSSSPFEGLCGLMKGSRLHGDDVVRHMEAATPPTTAEARRDGSISLR